MNKIHFLFCVHCHQPVGNFEHVLEESYDRCYDRFIDMLIRHKGIRCSLHYTGPLLEWIEHNRKEHFDKISLLVERNQVEILTGGFYEPIITVIPPRDAIGQIRMLSEYIKHHFNYTPRGMWLAERVWEPSLPSIMHDAGVDYSLLDDTHFTHAGLTQDDMFGYYITENEGKVLRLFPIDKNMRYLIPFEQAEETIAYLRKLAENGQVDAVTMGDDGEKFGIWPGTFEWVYTDGYLERLFTLLEENSEWLIMSTYSEYIAQTPPQGKIYLPTSSYEEMMEWALPSEAIVKYQDALHEIEEHGAHKDQIRPFFRGGFWRNFLAKYRESNLMHKKMLLVSNMVHKYAPDHIEARRELWRGQCNCAYWHGLFGGLYLNYLRNAIYQHLLSAERIVDELRHEDANWIDVDTADFAADGHDCLLLSSSQVNVYCDPFRGGSCFEIDYKTSRFNITNVFTRKFEAYHEKLKKFIADKAKYGDSLPQPKSIHDIIRVKEDNLDQYLIYDQYEKNCFVDHFLSIDTDLDTFLAQRHSELADFTCRPYDVVSVTTEGTNAEILLQRESDMKSHNKLYGRVLMMKKISLRDQCSIMVEYAIKQLNGDPIDLFFASELNLTFLASQSEDRYYVMPGNRKEQMNIQDEFRFTDEHSLLLINEWDNLRVQIKTPNASLLWRAPIDTVSQSEGGFERTYQQSMIVPLWKLSLKPDQTATLSLSLSFAPQNY